MEFQARIDKLHPLIGRVSPKILIDDYDQNKLRLDKSLVDITHPIPRSKRTITNKNVWNYRVVIQK